MDKQFALEILTPKGVQINTNVFNVTVKTSSGFITLLANHEPFISSIRISNININIGENKDSIYAIGTGALKFYKNKLTIVTDFLQKNDSEANAIELRKAEINKELKNSNDEISTLDKMEVYLEEEITKLKN
ncbi:MAG: hypothetical protein LBQ45_02600 [Mycoplasmataceae bacterium]|jgi:F-type H+-transporting ATPase subunit epsilon|nr:hypothetical protein [Mycoplasmataceae bacterium]